jgi:hypothetical protein
MDDDRRRRRQNEQSQYASSDPRYGQDQGQGRGFPGSSSDRFRAPPPLTSSPTASRGISGSAGYGYYAEPPSTFPATLPTNTMQYQTDYAPDQRQQQNFASYTSNMMYGVNQPAPQAAVYDQASQFQSRQPAAMQMLSDVASPYYAGEPTNATVAPVLQHQPSSSSTTVYQQSPADRNQILQGYAGNMTGLANMAPAPAEVIEDAQNYEPGGLDEAYTTYQNALKEVFLNIRNNMLVEASASLVEVSDWLLSHVGELGMRKIPVSRYLTNPWKGLTADDENLHSDRINLWNQFNTAWLAVLQRQKDLTEEILQTGMTPRQPHSLISADFLDRMAKELIRLCDNIEKHGLVDYQYGVWEERIIGSALLSESMFRTNC